MNKKNKKWEVVYTPEFMKSLKRLTGLRYRILSYIPDKYRNFRYNLQRFRRGYSDRDCWSIDYFLVDIIPKMLRQLKKNCHGCPGDLFDNKKKDNQCHKWDKVLIEMAEGFESGEKILNMEFMEDGDTTEQWKKKQELLYKKFDTGMKLFVKYFFNLWD